jgi:NET1-associated nuclear protein 1 (U3 small nucleolar RNA-associated protein 17)
LLVRTLLGNPLDIIAAYALSATNPNHLYVANAAGSIILWDWQTGREVLTIPMKWPIRALSVAQVHGTNYDTLFTIETQTSSVEGLVDHIVARQVRPGKSTATHTSLWHWIRKDILFLKVLDGGNVIFAACTERLVMGNVSSEYVGAQSRLDWHKFAERYTWREQTSGEALTCLDAQARPRPADQPVDRSNKLSHMSYDLVCGDVLGTTYIYDNFLYRMEERERKKKVEPLSPRVHKWHREAVNTVKWSLDGKHCTMLFHNQS